MKSVLVWIRANPWTVAAGVVAVIALAVLVWVGFMLTPRLNDRLAERENQVSQVEQMMRQQGTLPAESVDGPKREFTSATINQASVDRLKAVYGQLNQQYQAIYQAAEQHNRRGHAQLIPGLFPEAPESQRYNARDRYFNAFRWMLQAQGETDQVLKLPRLDAGPPLSAERLQMAVDRVRAPSSNNRSGEELTPQQQREQERTLFNRRQDAAVRALRNHAAQFKIYAQVNAGLDEEPGFPFYVRPWPAESDRPSMAQLWERQIELWIQQDIARAIANVNAEAASVLQSPVKRLIRMRVTPGYVGLHTPGAIVQGTENQSNNRQSELIARAGSDGALESAWRGAYPIPPTAWVSSEGGQTPSNFIASPSGRVSNPVYDVRHATVEVVVNYKKLPQLLNELSAVNFMTVLNTRIEDVDEYDALQRGYVYTGGDAVRVRLVLESTWLRSWTSDLMPTVTRQYLRIAEPPSNYQSRAGIPSITIEQ